MPKSSKKVAPPAKKVAPVAAKKQPAKAAAKPAAKPAPAAKATAKASAKPQAKPAAKASAASAELTGARALSLLKPRLAEVPKTALATLQADISAAAIVAQGVSKRTLAAALRTRFEKLASIGEFNLGDLELLSMAGLAAQEARQQADKALAKGTRAKVPLSVIKDAARLEHRMQGRLRAHPRRHRRGGDRASAALARDELPRSRRRPRRLRGALRSLPGRGREGRRELRRR